MKSIIHSFLAFSILVLAFSCNKEEEPIPVSDEYYEIIQQVINNGELLVSTTLKNDIYTLKFEKTIVEISANAIKEIQSDAANWISHVLFTDTKFIEIPFKGEKLDFIVKNIIVNPSGINPLSAKVEVLLPTFGRIKVVIHGKRSTSIDISHLFEATERRQHLPILGLYADYENNIELIYTDEIGNERGRTSFKIKTEPLEVNNFPKIFLKTAIKSEMEPGINLVSFPGQSELDTSLPYMLDDEGEVRWILLLKNSPKLEKIAHSIGLKRTKKGTYITGDMSEDRVVELDIYGNLLKEWDLKKLGFAFHHEITEAENGNFLITVSKNSAVLNNGKQRINDFIIELDPNNNSIVNEWDLANMLDTARYDKPDGITPPEFAQNPGNWAHNNSIVEYKSNLLATMRYQGIFNYTHEGSVKWIVAPHKGWGEKYKKYLLTPVDRNGNKITDSLVVAGLKPHPDFEWAWGPHTPFVLPNGNFIVFDNGYNRNFVNNFIPGVVNYSRAVEYRVNESNMTVQQVWEYGKIRGSETFSQALSGVQYLKKTGNVLFCPGMGTITNQGNGGHIIEVNPKTNKVVFEIQITSATYTAFHRVTRLSLYPENL